MKAKGLIVELLQKSEQGVRKLLETRELEFARAGRSL